MLALCRKELQLYFLSPTAYVAFAFYFLVTGLFFSLDFLSSQVVDVRPMFSNLMLIYLFTVPLLTMRLISDELRQGTDELLLTSPATLWEIVFGKYLAAMTLQFLLVAGALLYPLIMSKYGTLDQPVLWLSYLALFLLGSAMMAVGLFASSLSAHQMVAGIIGFALLLALWLIDWLGQSVFLSGKDWFSKFSITARTINFQKGVLNLSDVVFYLTLIVVFLVLSVQSLERKRWK
ncbi:ABC transporter permease [Paenibacillus sp. J31TS4]|uniref:ABC transporter permease n=1 Tax=Paenibacillus sp. J31TS4 TaxID=2807195 RepID=UPI001BCB1B02